MDFQGKTREEIEAFIAAAQAELERRTQVWVLRERFDWQVREFERLAAMQGPVPASPIPEGGFMPGQVVDADGTLYLNGSGAFIDYAPGDEPISEWVAVDEPPEPGEPEPEPPTPDYEEWDGNSIPYQEGERVTFEGDLYQARQPHTSQPGWTPVAVPALWERINA